MTNERAIAEAATEGPMSLREQTIADFLEKCAQIDADFPNYADMALALPAGHFREVAAFIAHFNPRRILELLEERDGLLQMPGQLTAAAARAQADMWHEANARARDDIQELYAALYKAWPHAEDMGDGSAKGVGHLIEQLTEERDGLVEALEPFADMATRFLYLTDDERVHQHTAKGSANPPKDLTVGDFRRARAALKDPQRPQTNT